MSRKLLVAALMTSALACTHDYVKADKAALGRVVIYRNGVAYFERRAQLVGNELTLSVPKDKVDDFLKSLTVKDTKSGKALPVSFPSPGNEVGGVVQMVIKLPNAASSDVMLSYITEAPAWKPSYRVVVGDDGKVHLQSWAIVDNTSGEDWKNVLVGVGSSSALSFRYDLWSVRNVHRSTLSSDDRFAIAPPTGSSTYGGTNDATLLTELSDGDIPRPLDHPDGDEWAESQNGSKNDEPMAEPPSTATRGGGGREQKYAAKKPRPASRPDLERQRRSRDKVSTLAQQLKQQNRRVVIEGYASRGEPDPQQAALDRANVLRNQLIDQGVPPANVSVRSAGAQDGRPAGVRLLAEDDKRPEDAQADGSPVGESNFESAIPMSVGRGSSVMVSIVNNSTEGEQVYLYDAESSRGNDRYAFKAVRLINPTDNALETGPVTVFGKSKFIGEGLIEPIPPRATALIPFALDRQIVVNREHDTRDRISRLVGLSRGVLTTEVQHIRRSKLTLSNRMKKPTTVYIKHTVADGWSLKTAPKKRERIGKAHLFAITLKGSETRTVEIEEATPLSRTLDLRAPVALDMIRVYLSSAEDPRLKEPMKHLLTIHKEMADHQTAIDNLHAQMDDYRVRMDELHVQIVSLKAVKSGGALMTDLKRKLQQISERVQRATLDVVSRQEKLMLARIKFQDVVAELTLERQEVAKR